MYHGVSYVKKIAVMCRLHGQKHMLFRQHVTTLFPEKVGAGTLGHPVVLSLIVQYTFLTAFGHKRLVSYLAVPYNLSLIKHNACRERE